MERGLYIAASGMVGEMVRQQQLANDLSNASTPGYKSDRVSRESFGDVMLRNSRTGADVGTLGAGARIGREVTDLTPQALRETGEPLDFGIAGEGYFRVRTPEGERFTRDGQFALSPNGTLITSAGHDVLGTGGQPVRAGADGKVDPRDLAVVDVPNATKDGMGLFAGTAGGAADGVVRAGALEGSGVEPARAMVDMIASLRAFEAGQKVITTIDETLGKAANQVGSIQG